nr:uncharacterized protein LOC101267435 isoform X2 [Solanum lycopersicum]
MGSFLYLTLTLISLSFTATLTSQAQGIKSSRLLDLVLRDNTFRYYNTKKFRTAKLYPIQLPSNLSGIKVDSVKYRCGSLTRYGAKIKEFKLPIGVKKKARMEELVRRAYEEEALQVSMVGHVRAPIAAGTRTVPTIEHEYSHHNIS